MPVLKAAQRVAGVHGVAFNLEDMTSKAQEYLGQVRAEAAKIVAEAQREAVAIRQRAEQEGQAAARAAVEKSIDQKIAKQMQSVLPALQQAVGEMHQAREAWLAHWERSAIHLAAEMARRIVRRHLPDHPEIPLNLVREALGLAAGNAEIRILLHPADHEALAGQVRTLATELSSAATTKVLADPSIGRGGCRVETSHGSIDQQFEAQLARIEEELA